MRFPISLPAHVRTTLFSFLLLSAPLVGFSLANPAVSFAQDEFDDEFDEDFEERERAPARPTQTTREVDEFGDEEAAPEGELERREEEAEAPSAAAPASRGRGGDLLRDRASDDWRNRRFVLHNTWSGSVGGIHVLDAGSGPSESFRAQLLTDFWFASGSLSAGDHASHIG